jgi:hypothetical protein
MVGLCLQGYRWLVNLLPMHEPDLLVEDLVHKQEQKEFISHYLLDFCFHVEIADSGEEVIDKGLGGIIRFGEYGCNLGRGKRLDFWIAIVSWTLVEILALNTSSAKMRCALGRASPWFETIEARRDAGQR